MLLDRLTSLLFSSQNLASNVLFCRYLVVLSDQGSNALELKCQKSLLSEYDCNCIGTHFSDYFFLINWSSIVVFFVRGFTNQILLG